MSSIIIPLRTIATILIQNMNQSNLYHNHNRDKAVFKIMEMKVANTIVSIKAIDLQRIKTMLIRGAVQVFIPH